MQLINFYYDYVVGELPEDNNTITKTKLLFDYLSESGLSEKDLLITILNDFPNKDLLTPEDLPNSLWDNSLLERDKFYFHKELQIISPPPTWDECFPFYLEMKIQYTINNVLDYFVQTFNINSEWINKEKELGSIKYLLKDYKKYSFVEPIDFILHLIDYTKSISVNVNSIYDLREYEIETAEFLTLDVENAKTIKKNVVIWRG